MVNLLQLFKDIVSEGIEREAHRREVMTPDEEDAYNQWLINQSCAPRIGATIPCPLNIEEIDARTTRPADFIIR